jgi:small ligand-binding sensory domain FIST
MHGETRMAKLEQMCWAAALSEQPAAREALGEVLAQLQERLRGEEPDLVLLFLSSQHRGQARAILDGVRQRYPRCRVFGCTASGVLGAGREIERREGLSAIAARLPRVALGALYCRPGVVPDVARLASAFGVTAADDPHFLVLGDPHDPTLVQLLAVLDEAYPRAVKVGGLFSGSAPGEGLLIDDDLLRSEGSMVLALSGNLRVHGLLSQGCRPVGEPMIVTRCRDNVIEQLNVGKPVEALRKLFGSLDAREQALCRHALHLGLEMKANAHEFHAGDFLVREVLGLDPNSGAMAVGARMQDYQVVQFHLRDGLSAARDLDRQFARLPDDAAVRWRAALMFSCTGRGQALFGVPNHDSDALARRLGSLPVAGFFAAGEIGRVEGTTFIHGYTSAIALFGER